MDIQISILPVPITFTIIYFNDSVDVFSDSSTRLTKNPILNPPEFFPYSNDTANDTSRE